MSSATSVSAPAAVQIKAETTRIWINVRENMSDEQDQDSQPKGDGLTNLARMVNPMDTPAPMSDAVCQPI